MLSFCLYIHTIWDICIREVTLDLAGDVAALGDFVTLGVGYKAKLGVSDRSCAPAKRQIPAVKRDG